jgi:hypothetical protein
MPAGPSSLGNRHTYDGPTVKPKSATTASGIPPLIGSTGASRSIHVDGRELIPIEGAAKAAAIKAGPHTDPFAFWQSYFKTHNESPGELAKTVRLLEERRKMRDVEAVLRGYLWNRPDKESWMYRALAMAIKINQGSPADVQTALNYAADLAHRTRNPNELVLVADTMVMNGYLDGVGALLDEAAAKVPHSNIPLRMMVNLAQQQKDPARMGMAVEKLLALGWPGEDDYLRTESRRQVDLLAKSLREDGKAKDADALLNRLEESEGRDVYIRLTWDGYASFEMAVDEPLGVTASSTLPRTVFGGSIIKDGFGAQPEEIYVCPRGFDGDYTVHVRMDWMDEKKPTVRLKLETITHEGTAKEQRNVATLQPEKLDKPIVVHLSGGRRKTVLPFVNPRTERVEIQAKGRPTPKKAKGAPVTGPGRPGAAPKARTAAKGAASP